jgi:Na+-translocating ferredoxin:NAD+ oxidoreductase RnfC subunit
MTAPDLLNKVFAAGVVGAGGAGFPTHVKLSADGVHTYLINGAECEPLLRNNMALFDEKTPFLVETAHKVGSILGVERVTFCVKRKHVSQIDKLRLAGADVFEMDDYYPAGDEIIMIQEATGLTVPEGGLPLQVGVVVNNVETLYNLGRAMEDSPVTRTWVTVGGAVANPGVWSVPIGTIASELVSLAGGETISNPVYVDGGPMTGTYRKSAKFPLGKRSNGILVVPSDSALVRYETMPVETMVRQARYACCQCTQCTMVCSRHLIGYELEPHKVMRAMAYPEQRTPEILKMAMLCSDCNLCSGLHGCPMQLSPRRINQLLKASFREKKVKFSFDKTLDGPDENRQYRLLPSKRLVRRIGLAGWDVDCPFMGEYVPLRVDIAMGQHIGAPCIPIVQVGQEVSEGQTIGVVPEGALGAPVHSSVNGSVESVSDSSVVIKARKG